MMVSIQRQSRFIAATHDTALLHLLLDAVMTVLAERLQVLRIEEQFLITTMSFDMVGDGRRPNYIALSTEATKWLALKLLVPKPIPALV